MTSWADIQYFAALKMEGTVVVIPYSFQRIVCWNVMMAGDLHIRLSLVNVNLTVFRKMCIQIWCTGIKSYLLLLHFENLMYRKNECFICYQHIWHSNCRWAFEVWGCTGCTQRAVENSAQVISLLAAVCLDAREMREISCMRHFGLVNSVNMSLARTRYKCVMKVLLHWDCL